MIIETMNSTYELDELNKRMRRIAGPNSETRFDDLDWHCYEDLLFGPEIGKGMLVCWDVAEGKATILSPIQSIAYESGFDANGSPA